MTNWRAITVALALAGCTDAARELTAPPPAPPPPPPPSFPSGAAVIAFVSTRDGGGPEAGYQSVPWIYLAAGDGTSVQRLTRERPRPGLLMASGSRSTGGQAASWGTETSLLS